jgi:hypothetical protein
VGGPSAPFTIPSGSQADLVVQFRPTVGGIETATFQINSDDPASPAAVPASAVIPETDSGLLVVGGLALLAAWRTLRTRKRRDE